MRSFREMAEEQVNEGVLKNAYKWLLTKSRVLRKIEIDNEKQYGYRLPVKVIEIEFLSGDEVAEGYALSYISSKEKGRMLCIHEEEILKGDKVKIAGPIKSLSNEKFDIFIAKKV